jgi:peptidoglycan/LPS O-acetylase OafA/YrhL
MKDAHESTKRFLALDSWRGIFAVMVALTHLSVLGHFYYWTPIRNAGFGVDFFFVLSGFVISHVYSHKLSSRPEISGYLLRRFGRIYPLHVFTLFMMIIIEATKLLVVVATGIKGGEPPFEGTNTVASIIDNLLLMQGMGVSSTYTWNGPSWSISTEFWTYIAFAFVVFVTPRRLAIAAFLICSISLWIIVRIDMSGAANLTGPRDGIWHCLYGFFAGVIVHNLVINTSARLRVIAGWLEPAAVIITLIFLSISWNSGLIATAVSHALAPLAPMCVVWCFAFQQGVFSKMLMTKMPMLLGKISFSIYMVHFIVITVMNSITRLIDKTTNYTIRVPTERGDVLAFGGPWTMDLVALMYLVTVIGLAYFTYCYVEEPGRRFFNRLAQHLFGPRTARAQNGFLIPVPLVRTDEPGHLGR